MNIFKKLSELIRVNLCFVSLKKWPVALTVFLLFLCCTGFAVYAVQHLLNPISANDPKIIQLSHLSGIDRKTVVRLYKAVGDEDKLIKNIMVYKQLLDLVEGIRAEKQLFHLIPEYDSSDLYVAYDYLVSDGLPTGRIEELLTQRAKGGDWDAILAGCNITKEYKKYKVLGKDELHRLLGQGYSPDDIIQADSIAKAKDLPLEDVLKRKTPDKTWDEVANALGYRGRAFHQKANLSVPGLDKNIGDKGFAALVAAGNRDAEERKRDDAAKIKAGLGLTDVQMESYLNQGYSPWDVQNAFRLAKANNTSPEDVLAKKKTGMSWEEILAAYPKK
ncbi:MAG: hypothetical protein AB1500_09415 [Bacillota bacterium]